MNFDAILAKKEQLDLVKNKIHSISLESYEKDFELRFTHNSTAIEGNTLTLMETKVVLEDEISIGGKQLREIYEVINHKKAYQYVKKSIRENKCLDEGIIKDIHSILMDNILIGGIYRNVEVRISGSNHVPPSGNEMYIQIKNFYEDMQYKTNMNPIELAAWTHAEFVRVHPFVDGNGRTSRLIMNYQLLAHGYLPVSIAKEDRLDYYNALEQYALNGNLEPFTAMICKLEEEQLDKYIELAKNNQQ